jgi:Flp pilus assembly protein TadG
VTSERIEPRARRDSGVTLILVSLLLTVLVVMAAFAVDGGRAYANRRQMQNAADLAAVAGTRYYATHRFLATPPGDVQGVVAAVVDQATTNKSDITPEQLDCWMVDASTTPRRLPLGNPIDICDNPTTAWASFSGASGVEVSAARTQDTFLVKVIDIDSLSASAQATATMQPLVAAVGGAPFIVCGYKPAGGFDIVDGSGDVFQSTPPLNTLYPIQGPDPGSGKKDSGVPDCGAGGNAFDGTGDHEPPVIGQWVDAGNGNGFSEEILTAVVGSSPCTPDMTVANGCRMVLPIANAGRATGSKIEMFIVTFGVFEIYGRGSGPKHPLCETLGNPAPKYCGRLLAAVEVSGGTGGQGEVEKDDLYLIKLVE